MSKSVIVVVAAIALAGCGQSAVQSAHKAVAYQLMDPDSAKFRADRVLATGSVCGEVNGKNAFGAYTGFTPYSAQKTDTGLEIHLQGRDMTVAGAQMCGYPATAAANTGSTGAPVTTARPAGDLADVRWAVELASVSSPEVARGLTEKLSGYGLSPYVRHDEHTTHVYVGPFDTHAVATNKLDELHRAHHIKGFVVRYREPSKEPAQAKG